MPKDPTTTNLPATADVQIVEEPSFSASSVLQSSADVAVALSLLDNRYKESIASYAQTLQACNRDIDTARHELDALVAQKEPYDKQLDTLGKETDHALRMVEHLSDRWIERTVVLTELKRELSDSEDADLKLQVRYDELAALALEIEETEELALGYELERQNTLLSLEPLEQKIRAQEKKLKALESHKRYIESAHLHRIGGTMPSAEESALLEKSTPSNDTDG